MSTAFPTGHDTDHNSSAEGHPGDRTVPLPHAARTEPLEPLPSQARSASTFGVAATGAPATGAPATGAPATPPPPPPAAPAHPDRDRPRRGASFAQLGLTALLAATLASGATIAIDRTLTNSDVEAGPAIEGASGSSPIVQTVDGNTSWTAVASAVTPSVVSITVQSQAGNGEGSGVVWDAEGHIVTNNHVVEGAGQGGTVSVTMADGRTYEATVKGTDPTTDLAVIQLTSPPSDLTPISRGDSTALEVGDPVMAVGNPLGLSGTVTTGIVSALNRPVAASNQQQQNPFGTQQQQQQTLPQVTNAIQTSAAINPGNSGGALVNAQGELVGINSSIATLGSSMSGTSGNIGIGFAIPVKEAETIVSQLVSSGSAQHAYLGISTRDETVEQGTSSVTGALVADVVSGGPAADAGLRSGDVITEINGQSTPSSQSLIGTIRGLAVGEQVSLTVMRDGNPVTVDVTLAAAPTN